MNKETSDGWTRAAMVVGGVVRRDDTILLVHEHTMGGEGPDQWVLPGGRLERGELLDAAVKREVKEETGLTVESVDSLAFGSQHYAPGRNQPLLFLAFNVAVTPTSGDRFEPDDPDDLIIEARFVPIDHAIDLVLQAGITPGSQSTADFLRGNDSTDPSIWLWDLNRSAEQPLSRVPARSELGPVVADHNRTSRCTPADRIRSRCWIAGGMVVLAAVNRVVMDLWLQQAMASPGCRAAI